MTEGRTVKVERSRARGHVASNTLTVWPGVIKSRVRFYLGPLPEACPNKSIPVTKNPRLGTVRFFEASADDSGQPLPELNSNLTEVLSFIDLLRWVLRFWKT